MVEASPAKRIRIRTKATDSLSLARSFKSHLTRQSIFIKSAKALQSGTAVIVELLYANGERAIYGEGKVSWARSEGADKPAGLAIDLEWDPPSKALVEQILSAPSMAPPPSLLRSPSSIGRASSTPHRPVPAPPPPDFGAAFAEETSQHGSVVQIDEPTGRFRRTDLPLPAPPSRTPSGVHRSVPPVPPPPALRSSAPPPTALRTDPAPPADSLPPPPTSSVPPMSASADVVAVELLGGASLRPDLPAPTADIPRSSTADIPEAATADIVATPESVPPAASADPAPVESAPSAAEASFFESPATAAPAEGAATETPTEAPAAEKKGVWGWLKKAFGG